MSMSSSNFQPIIDSFKKKYPFIKEVQYTRDYRQ